MNADQSFGQVVKARRYELGLTQDELARLYFLHSLTWPSPGVTLFSASWERWWL
jgi:transcriptional regulator with XRE-family HTH domain